VVHLAADKQVEESVHQPLRYYRRNMLSLMQLLTAMEHAEVDRLVFSSSAAVYGMVESQRVDEDDRTEPINPYGETKLIGEWLIRDQARAAGLRFAALRYFNVVGAAAPELGDRGCSNLVPMIFDAIRRGEQPRIFGSDYDTPDGTCVRDYIHVADLADAHVAAIAALNDPAAELIVNVGCGRGYSVREVVDMVAEVIGIELDPVYADRRPGDPASVVADTSRIRQLLGWQARYDLADMVRSAWQAEQARAEQASTEPAVAPRSDPALAGGR
jgi:UDP-glucose 4-epimerase